jgi:hypothetical protein
MAPDSQIAALKDVLVVLKKDGIENVSVDALMEYLTKLETTAITRSPAELEHYKAQLAAWVEKQKEFSNFNLEGFKSVILAGQNAIRIAILLNGGAAVAMLAYIGKLSVEASASVSQFALPLFLFVLGALTVAVGAGVTYLSQWFYFSGGGNWRWRVGFTLNMLAILLGLTSYGLFAAGAWWAYQEFKAYT